MDDMLTQKIVDETKLAISILKNAEPVPRYKLAKIIEKVKMEEDKIEIMDLLVMEKKYKDTLQELMWILKDRENMWTKHLKIKV